MDNTANCTGRLRNMTAIYLTSGDKILLLYRQGSRVVNDVWTGSAGGHFEPHELGDAKACVMRELYEELHLTEDMLDGLEFRYVTLRCTGGEIRQNYYFFAQLKDAERLHLTSDEGQLRWFDIAEVPSLPMPFTAYHVLMHWLSTGRYDNNLYGGVTTQTGVEFTCM